MNFILLRLLFLQLPFLQMLQGYVAVENKMQICNLSG